MSTQTTARFTYDVATPPFEKDLLKVAAGYGVLAVTVEGFLAGDVVEQMTCTVTPTSGTTIERTIVAAGANDDGQIDTPARAPTTRIGRFSLTADDVALIAAGTYTYAVRVWVTRSGVTQYRDVQTGAITATRGLASVTGLLTVASVTITGGPTTALPGATLQLTASPTDALGAPVAAPVTWRHSNAAAATVDANGLVTFVNVGASTITATCQGHSATIVVTCSDPAFPNPQAGDALIWNGAQGKFALRGIGTEVDTLTASVTGMSGSVAALQAGQAANIVGYATQAALFADLAHPAGTVGYVNADPTAANNGFYLKSGASGAGSWTASPYDRVALVEGRATTLETQGTTHEQKLTQMATLVAPITNVAENVPPIAGGPFTISSTFSGWLGPLGTPQGFNRTEFDLYPFDGLLLPTKVRLLIWVGDIGGAVLVDQTVNITAALNTKRRVVFDHPTVANAGAAKLYAGFFTDGHASCYSQPQATYLTTASGNAAARYSTKADITKVAVADTVQGGAQVPYFKTSFVDTANAVATPVAAYVVALDGAMISQGTTVGKVPAALARVATDTYPVTGTIYSPAQSGNSWPYLSSTFSGWGGPIGLRQDVDAVRFYLQAFDAAHIPTKVRVQLWDTDWNNGAALADVTVNVSLAVGVPKLLEVLLPARVAPGVAKQLYLTYFADGYTGFYGQAAGTTYPRASFPPDRYVTLGNMAPSVMNVDGVANALYVEVVTMDRTKPIALPTSAFSQNLASAIGVQNDYDALYLPAIPPYVYACGGPAGGSIEMNLYHASLIDSEAGKSSTVGVTSSLGQELEECHRHGALVDGNATGTAITSVGVMNYYVRDRGVLRASGTSYLRVAPHDRAPGTFKLLILGDSLVKDGTAQQQLNARALADGVTTFTHLGTQLTTNGAIHCEGRGGWTVDQYNGDDLTNGASPFVFGGAFNFGQYLSTNGVATPDVVIIEPGVNDCLLYASDSWSDAEMLAYAQARMAKVDAWITSIHAAAPSAVIGIHTITTPALTQDPFGLLSGSKQRSPYVRRKQIWLRAQLAQFKGREKSNNVWLLPTAWAIDPVYGFPTTSVAPFVHSSDTIVRRNNTVHPNSAGYKQLGDCWYASLKVILSTT